MFNKNDEFKFIVTSQICLIIFSSIGLIIILLVIIPGPYDFDPYPNQEREILYAISMLYRFL